MGYPAAVCMGGYINAWTAVGLIVFMFLNWQLVAPKIRVATEQFSSLTFSSFFESRLADTSGMIRVFTAIMSLIFYTIYISAGLVGLGLLAETLFEIPYSIGIFLGIAVIVPYVFMGGFVTLAWIDLFQGLFLMLVIIFVPLYIFPSIGGFQGISEAIHLKHLTGSMLPDFSSKTWLEIFYMLTGFGLGYFGQPHIVTKFMGIKNVHEISKSKMIGMSWMVLSLGAATLVGLAGIAFFPLGLLDPQQIFIEMVRMVFHPILIGFFLCAVLAATINAISSQVLVLTSSLTEDFYKRIFRKNASSHELLLVSRIGVVVIALVAFLIAYKQLSTIYSLVQYAWSGLGSAFGPLLLLSLYSQKINKYGAWTGILIGGVIAGIWPYLSEAIDLKSVPSLLPGFVLSFLSILIVSAFTKKIPSNA